jgi:ribonuclease P protein component
MSDEKFPKSERLRKRKDFIRVETDKKFRIVTEHLIVLAAANSKNHARIGITVSKRIGSAVKRNRYKRLLREIYRRHKEIFPPGYDIVLIARKQDTSACYKILFDEITHALGSHTW